MPLHLLGKKSWNVYNTDNIARVRRDEAEAQARNAEEERRQRAQDGDARLAHLRASNAFNEKPATPSLRDIAGGNDGRPTKKRRLIGEDDTDRDIRLTQSYPPVETPSKDTSLIDARGHSDLVQRAPGKVQPKFENNQAEMGVRLADAAGRGPHTGKPWYNTPANAPLKDDVGRDVWGNEDPRRHEREKKRVDASDPLAAMKRGVKQLRHAEAQRREWRNQRERDLVEIEELARKEEKRHRRRGDGDDGDSLDGFDLDAGVVKRRGEDGKGRSRHERGHHDAPRRHHRHHWSRSRSPQRGKERRRSRDALASKATDR